MKIGVEGRVRSRWPHTHTYREDNCRHALELVFLDGGSASTRLDEDAPIVMAMVTVDIIEAGRTCEIPERWVSSINAGRVLIPFLLGVNPQVGLTQSHEGHDVQGP
jgi:hypothetical protein